jgi:hypothetical protein
MECIKDPDTNPCSYSYLFSDKGVPNMCENMIDSSGAGETGYSLVQYWN